MSKRGNGEGTIFYHKTLKRWIGQFTAGINIDGSINRKTVYGKTRREVSEKLIAKQQEINTKTFINKSNIVFENLAEEIIERQYNNNLIKCSSYLRRIDTLKILKKTPIAKMKIQDISIIDINTTLSSLTNYSNSSINKVNILINNTLDYAVLNKVIPNNPYKIKGAIIKPKSNKKDKIIEALTIDEQKALVEELNKSNDEYKDILLIALYSGMRIGEILALSAEDIDLKNNLIHINKSITKTMEYITIGDTTKTYSGTRDIPILPQLMYVLKRYNNRIGLLFTNKGRLIQPTTINSHFKKICKDAGIKVYITKKKKDNKYVNLKTSSVNTHMLRHTFATRCIESGMSAIVLSKILGHKSIEITLDTYTSVFNKYTEEEIQKVTYYLSSLQ